MAPKRTRKKCNLTQKWRIAEDLAEKMMMRRLPLSVRVAESVQ